MLAVQQDDMAMACSPVDIIVEPLDWKVATKRLEAVRESREILEPHFSWCDFPYDESQNKQFIQEAEHMLNNRRGLFMSVLHRQSHIYLGEVAIDKVADDRSSVNLMYWIRKDQWNKGYASAALHILLSQATYYLSVQYAVIMMEEENHASKRVAEKIGARYNCAIANMIDAKGQCKDVFCFHYHFNE